MGQTTNKILPETYYLDYFNFLLEFTQKNYPNIFLAPEKDFIEKFQNLSFEAQCLFVRLSNRKGPLFRGSKLVYREIPNVGHTLEELGRSKLISLENKSEAVDLLFLFTKPEILRMGKSNSWHHFYRASDRKEDIIFSIIGKVADKEISEVLFDEDSIIFFECTEVVAFLKLLFFGDLYSDMTQFVIRDVGHIKLENFDEASFSPHFSSRQEIDTFLEVAKTYEAFKVAKEVLSPLGCFHWFEDLTIKVLPPYDSKTGKLYSKLIMKLGKHLESASFYLEALSVYQKINVAPARERQVRLLVKLNEHEEAILLAKEISDRPDNPEEELFAKDFINSGKSRIKRSTTASLKQGKEIELEKEEGEKVEHLVIKHFQAMGYQAYHTENTLWRFLFGLIFWEEIFDLSQGTFHHPLQRLPSDLHQPAFYQNREKAIQRKVQQLRTRSSIRILIEKNYELKNGISNHLVYWDDQLLSLALKTVELLPLNGLKNVLIMIAKQVKSHSTGFPDLMVYRGNSYHFYEVKSPNDHLSAQQLFWIEFLKEQKIKASILKIKWS